MLHLKSRVSAANPENPRELQTNTLWTKPEFPTTSEPVDKPWKTQKTVSHNLTTVIHPLTTGRGAGKGGTQDACGAMTTGFSIFKNKKTGEKT